MTKLAALPINVSMYLLMMVAAVSFIPQLVHASISISPTSGTGLVASSTVTIPNDSSSQLAVFDQYGKRNDARNDNVYPFPWVDPTSTTTSGTFILVQGNGSGNFDNFCQSVGTTYAACAPYALASTTYVFTYYVAPEPDPVYATSSTDQVQQNLFHGILLFLFGVFFFFLIIATIKHN